MKRGNRHRPAADGVRPSGPCLASVLCTIALIAGCHDLPIGEDANWSNYNGHPDGDHYSSLADINTSNVGQLKEAWRTTWAEPGDPETNPLVIDGIVFGYTPALHIVALDGATGRTLWTFDPGLQGIPVAPGIHFTGPARGMAFWQHGKDRRLLAGVMQYLFAIEPSTGRLVTTFGKDGAIDLREGLRGDPAGFYVSLTTPGIVFEDELIVGFRTGETHPAPPGDIRAFDVRTGKLRWQFHTIPHRVNPAARAGPNPHCPRQALRTTGQAWRWMRSGASCMCRPDLRSRTFMVPTVSVTTFMPIRSWRWMPAPANGYGTSKVYTTTCGTATSRRLPPCSPSNAMGGGFLPWRRRPSRAMCTCSTA